MALQLRTYVHESKLEKWCAELPDCEEFLQNFFWTCRPYDYNTNKYNFVDDIAGQLLVDKEWYKFCQPLLQAFEEIAYRGEELN
ncbi:hypothetical protein HZC30_00735 [Candidatus Woesearchaeota archaeon]|nr:hypothetical protein [Candidatus Woesearchaeota archaeon]